MVGTEPWKEAGHAYISMFVTERKSQKNGGRTGVGALKKKKYR